MSSGKIRKTGIFDYQNKLVEIELRNVKIVAISVTILSGDETVDIYYEDGKVNYFDSSESRHTSFFDGNYVVLGDKIDEWLKWNKFLNYSYISYKRQEMFAYEN